MSKFGKTAGKTVFITGAAGFIGLNIAKEFVNAGWNTFALVRNNIPADLKNLPDIKIIQGDLTDKNFISNLNIDADIVVHAAGLASDTGSDEIFRKINFEPVKYLCRLPKKKFIFISSSDVYGIKDFDNADENTPLLEYPKNPYPKYKIKSELWLKENCPVPYVFIRPAAVYGEGDKTIESRVIDFLRTSPFIIHFGRWRGKNRWPKADVKNVSKTVLALTLTDSFDNQAVTIIDPQKTTIDEYYREIAAKHFPGRKYKTITLPLAAGKALGAVSSFLSNLLHTKQPVFDPSFYAVHHVSSNLDFSSAKMEQILKQHARSRSSA